MKTSVLKTIMWVSLFAIAMGYLETSVVVYLRELYYQNGFDFPLRTMDMSIAWTEIFREAATIIMLFAAGVLAGKKLSERFAYFMYAFAIWDIFYYVFLKVLLDWPESLMTWDILFLIPVTWTGPVLSPVILALVMTGFALLIIYFNQLYEKVVIKTPEWWLLSVGSLIVIVSFTWDYMDFIFDIVPVKELFRPGIFKRLMELSQQYIPESFPWLIYSFGTLIIISGIVLFARRYIQKEKS